MGINPYELAAIKGGYVNNAANVDTTNNINTQQDEILTPPLATSSLNQTIYDSSTLSEAEHELIEDELKRKLEELKAELADSKETKGVITTITDGIAGLFGKGDKGKENKIANYDAQIKALENGSIDIIQAYQNIIGTPLDTASLEALKTSKTLASSLDTETLNAIAGELENQLGELEGEFQSAKNKNGWISGTWDKFKNWSGIGASSNKTQAQIDDLKEQIKTLKDNPKELANVFKNITGQDLNVENLSAILNRDVTLLDASKAGESINKYSEGQSMVTDVVADMTSGIAAVGVVALGTAVGICAAPFTAGASLGLVAAGLGMAAGTGAVVKSAIKASDCIGNEKEYTLKNLGYDITTGALNGAMAPLSNAIGGAAGTSIMKAAGMEALETQVVKSAAAAGGKAIIKEAGEKVVLSAGQKAVKLAATGVTMALDGGLSGATDAFARDIATGNTDNLLKDTVQGFGMGAAGGVVIGGGFKVAGKAGAKLGSTEAAQALGGAIKKTTSGIGNIASDAVDGLASHSRIVSNISGALSDLGDTINTKAIATSLKNCLSIGDDGLYNVNVGSYTVKLTKDELSQEILEGLSRNDNTAIFNYAKTVLNDALSEQAQKEAIERATLASTQGEAQPKGLKDKAKNFIKEKLEETKTGQRIKQDYEIAKSNFLNKPEIQNADSKVMSEIGEYFANVRGLVEGEDAFNEGLGKLVGTISDVSSVTKEITIDLAQMSDDFAYAVNKQNEVIQDLLQKISAGEDVSEAVANFANKGISISDFVSEKTISNLDSFASKMEQMNIDIDDCAKTAMEFAQAVDKNSGEIASLYSDAKDILNQIPDTKAFSQLGEMPDRVKTVIADVQKDAIDIAKQYDSALTKINAGDIEAGLLELDSYYKGLVDLQTKLTDVASQVDKTAKKAGLFDTATTLADRLKAITSKEGYSQLTTTQKMQSIVEESNIAFSKIIQTMSSDETLPDGVRSFFKEFTSNCTVSRNLDEAQMFADEIYGAGKYTIKQTIGAGSVGETYLVSDINGNEFVMKMLKQGVNQEKFEADRAMFTKYINEFITDAADKEYKLNLINGLFDSWEKELDYGSEAIAAKEMASSAKRFNVAQTVEVGAKEGNNVSLVMEKAKGIGLDDLIDLLDFKNQHPDDYLTLSMVNSEGKELNPWIRKSSLIEANDWIKDTDAYAEALPVAYQKAQNEQSMFLSKEGVKTVHADPHGGNVFVDFDPKTGTPKITYIDTGNTLTRTNAEILSDISLSLNMLIGNSEGIATSLLDGATLPSGMSQKEAIEQVAKLLDDKLYKAGINLKDVNYTQSTMMGILSDLNIIPDSSNSNLLKANLQRIKTSREIFAVTGTEANKTIDIKDMLTGIKQSFISDPKGTMKTIKPIVKWAFENKDQSLITFFQMMFKESSFNSSAANAVVDAVEDSVVRTAASELADASVRSASDDIADAILRESTSFEEALGTSSDEITETLLRESASFEEALSLEPELAAMREGLDDLSNITDEEFIREFSDNLYSETDYMSAREAAEVFMEQAPQSSYEISIQNKINELNLQAYTKSYQTLTYDGKTADFEYFVGTQAGSNQGGYVLNKETGELFYAKVGSNFSNQTKTEVLASKIYNLAGIDAPELTTFTSPEGTKGLLSKYIPDLEVISSADSAVNEGFAMDAFLANWDAVCSDNALKTADGAVRIDVGGTFDYRAQGAKKPFGAVVDEITTLADPNINPTSAKIFSTMTKDDLIESLRKVVDIDDNDLIRLVESEGMDQYKDVLLQRKQYLADFLEVAEKTPDDGLDISTYLQKVKNETYKTTIDGATSETELVQIQESINNSVKDIETKQILQEQLKAKKVSLENALKPQVVRQLDTKEVGKLLEQSVFVLDIDNHYYVNLPDGFEASVAQKYGSSNAKQIIYQLKTPLSEYDVEKLTSLMNISNGKYLELFQEDMLETVAFFKTLDTSSSSYNNYQNTFFKHFDEFSDGQAEAIVNAFKNKADVNALDALDYYKGSGYGNINGALTEMVHNKDYVPSPKIQAQIDAISDYIDKQPITQSMTVYRGEGYEVLDSVDVGGKKLSELMKKAAKSGNEDEIDNLILDVKMNNYVATQERFMSTSLLESSAFNDDVIWELECPAGSKGVFLEGTNITGALNKECEYLLQKDSKITITGISFDGKHWHLNGTINN